MRVIHLCFSLHEPERLRDDWWREGESGSDLSQDSDLTQDLNQVFDDKAEFARQNERVYQPFFALLERSLQKHHNLHFSLLVSGIWLSLAERFDPELVKRLKRILGSNQVDLIATPFYYSVSFFYDRAEFREQVRIFQEKAEKLLGVKPKFFAAPKWLFNNQLARAAETERFAGVLASGAEEALDFRSTNHVYEVESCDYLRVLFNNEYLTRSLTDNYQDLLEDQKVPDGSTVQAISWTKFRKMLDLSSLRGGLLNLYFDAEIFGKLRQYGIVKFFEEMWSNWPETEGNGFVSARGASTFEVPRQEISIPETIGEEMFGQQPVAKSTSLVKAEEVARLPEALAGELDERWSHQLYSAKKNVFSSENETLTEIWRRLTAVDYLVDLNEDRLKKLETLLTELKNQVEHTKKAQVVEIAREMTKKPNMMRIQIVDESKEPKEPADEEPELQVVDEEMPDALHDKLREFGLKILDDEGEAEPEPAKSEPKKREKPKKKRRFMRKLVIE